MKISDIESRLESVSFVEPSEYYFAKGQAIIAESTSYSNPSHGMGKGLCYSFAAILFVSLLLNLAAFSGQGARINIPGFDSVDQHEAILSTPLNDMPGLISDTVGAASPVFSFLCFTRTSAIVDNTYFVGELNGFGEWVTFEIPDFFRLSFSLLPIRDWKPVGEFRDGAISIELEDRHLLTLIGTGLGPSGVRKADSAVIYGEVEKIESDSTDRTASKNLSSLNIRSEALMRNMAIVAEASFYGKVQRSVLGVDTALDPVVKNMIDPILASGECG